MSTPDIRVRLTPEGVKEVVNALKTVQGQADRFAKSAGSGFNSLQTAATKFKAILPALGLTATTAGFVAMTRAALNTADAVGKLAQSVGATAEGVSTLQFAAKTADVSTEQLGTGLIRLAANLGNLERGTKTTVDSFRRLGLSIKDFAGLDTVQAFDLIAQRLGKVADGTRKTEIAIQIFGRAGAQLIPLLNDLAANGFASVEEAARSLGLVIDTETANTAAAVNDSFTLIKAQAEGLALQFTAGLAPSVLEAMDSFRDETAGKGVESIRTFGAEVGRVLRTVIATFRTFFTIISGIFTGIGNRIGEIAAIAVSVGRGEFGQALNIWRDAEERSRADYERFKESVKRDFARVVEEATKEVAPLSASAARTGGVAAATDEAAVSASAAAARRAAAEAAKAEREAARLAEERRRAEEAAGRTRFDIEQRLLELTGQQREAKLRALDEELAKQRQILDEAGGVTATDEQNFARIRAVEASRIDFEDAFERAQQALETLAAQRQRIQQEVELGITTQREGQLEIAAIEAERLPIMQQIAAEALTAAQASGDPALIAQAEQLNLALGQVAVSVNRASDAMIQFKEGAAQALEADLANFLSEGITQAENFGDAMKGLADSVIRSLQRIAAEIIAQQIITGLMGMLSGFGGGARMSGLSEVAITAQRIRMGGIVRRAGGGIADGTAGGRLSGPGTGTSDSIPAITTRGRAVLLSSGEFIVREAVVRQPGMLPLLQKLNGGLPVFSAPSTQSRFASGGMVGEGAPIGGVVINQNFHITSATGSVDRTSQQQVAAAAARGAARASQRNN